MSVHHPSCSLIPRDRACTNGLPFLKILTGPARIAHIQPNALPSAPRIRQEIGKRTQGEGPWGVLVLLQAWRPEPEAAAVACVIRTPTSAHSSTMIIRQPRSIGHFILELMSLSIPLISSWAEPTCPCRIPLFTCCMSFLNLDAASPLSIAPYPLSARSLGSRVLSNASKSACDRAAASSEHVSSPRQNCSYTGKICSSVVGSAPPGHLGPDIIVQEVQVHKERAPGKFTPISQSSRARQRAYPCRV